MVVRVVVIAWLSASLAACGQSSFTLPPDVHQPVIELSLEGGLQVVGPRGEPPAPVIQVFADGRVVAGAPGPQYEASEWWMPRNEWHWFFDEIAERYRFFELDGKAIQRQIELLSEDQVVMDAGTTVLRLRAAERDHRVRVFAAAFYARQHPELEDLQRSMQIERRFRWLASVAHLGGFDPLDQLVQAANGYLAELSGKFPNLARDDLFSSARGKDQTIQVVFRKEFRGEDGQAWSVTVTGRRSDGKLVWQHLKQPAAPSR